MPERWIMRDRDARANQDAIGQERLARLRVSRPVRSGAAGVVSELLAVQAQDYHAALWAIGLRGGGATVAEVEQAVAAGTIVRSWPMRGTLHFVAADDLRWMLALLASRLIGRGASRHRQLGLDNAVFQKSRRVVERFLRDGLPRTRGDVFGALDAAGIATAASRGLHIANHLAHEGVICVGPRHGKQPTFVLLDAWVPRGLSLTTDEALGELAARYFAARGPATIDDLAWWSGLSLGLARKAVEIAGRGNVAAVAGGPLHRGHSGARPPRGATTHLLPAFDEFLVGYRDRSAVLEPAHAKRVNQGGGMLHPVVVTGGRVVGTWSRKLSAGAASIAVESFVRLGEGVRAGIEADAQRYRQFVDVGQVDVGYSKRSIAR